MYATLYEDFNSAATKTH